MHPQLPTSKISASQLPHQVIASNPPPACFLSCRLFRTSFAPSSATTQIMAQMHKINEFSPVIFHFCCFQPFQSQLASTTDPDKKQMLERLDAAVTAALQPLQAAMERTAAEEVVQPLAQVRMRSHSV